MNHLGALAGCIVAGWVIAVVIMLVVIEIEDGKGVDTAWI